MRKFLLAVAVFGVALVLAPQTRAQDEAKAIIEKAIKAHGGADKLAKTKAVRSTAKGTLQLMGQTLAYTETSTIQQPNQFKSEVTLEIMGQQIPIIVVYDGKTCWAKGPQGVMEDPPLAADEIKTALYAARVGMLKPLLEDKSFTLSLLGESKVKGKAAVGVKVSSKGQKDIDLYFDKADGLIVKVVRPVLDMGGGEVMEERFLSDYKDFEGLKRPTKLVAERGGNKYLDAESVDVKFFDKIDANEFSKP
jgi:hypothetical protein